MNRSILEKTRLEYIPKLPKVLRDGISEITILEGNETKSVSDCQKIKKLFPNTYGKKK